MRDLHFEGDLIELIEHGLHRFWSTLVAHNLWTKVFVVIGKLSSRLATKFTHETRAHQIKPLHNK